MSRDIAGNEIHQHDTVWLRGCKGWVIDASDPEAVYVVFNREDFERVPAKWLEVER